MKRGRGVVAIVQGCRVSWGRIVVHDLIVTARLLEDLSFLEDGLDYLVCSGEE